MHSSAATTIGHLSRKHEDWFDENDEEIKLLLEEKHCLHKAHQDDTSSVSKKAAFNNIYKTIQNRFRDMQDSWLRKKANLEKEKKEILKRWAEHFNSVLNRPSSANDNAINRLSQIECNVLLDEFLLVKHQVQMQFLLKSIKLVDFQWQKN